MAPSAVETITVPVVNPIKRTHFGAYKELAPTHFDPEAEAGKKGFTGAKVGPAHLSSVYHLRVTSY